MDCGDLDNMATLTRCYKVLNRVCDEVSDLEDDLVKAGMKKEVYLLKNGEDSLLALASRIKEAVMGAD